MDSDMDSDSDSDMSDMSETDNISDEAILDYLLMEDGAISPDESPPPKRGPGRPAFHIKYPRLPEVVEEFIAQHGVAAHDRRHTDTQYSVSVHLRHIRTHVLSEIPEMAHEKLNLTTIERLMYPPRWNSGAAPRYKCLVNAKLAYSKNDMNENPNPDTHYASAQVKYVMEAAALHPEEVVVLSCDAKNKLTMGLPSVHRLNQFNKFCLAGPENEEHRPNFPDHDFPKGPNRKLTPVGYQFLEKKYSHRRSRSLTHSQSWKGIHKFKKARSSSAETVPSYGRSPQVAPGFTEMDKKGRIHVPWTRTGPLHVFLKCDRFVDSNSQVHINQLTELLVPYLKKNPARKSVVLFVDGGPDWNGKYHINVFNFGRLWRDLNLEALILVSYGPGSSKYNPIERCWAKLNDCLSGSTVPDTVEIETMKGVEKRNLGDRCGAFDSIIYQNAVLKMTKYWHGQTINGFPIIGHNVLENKGPYFCHNIIRDSFKTPKRDDLNDVQESAWGQLPYIMSHVVRKKYCLMYAKCSNDCCKSKSSNFITLLRQFNGMIPNPVQSTIFKNSYDTFYESLIKTCNWPILSFPDEGLPSNSVESVRNSCEYGCAMYLYSNLDKCRHYKLVHNM